MINFKNILYMCVCNSHTVVHYIPYVPMLALAIVDIDSLIFKIQNSITMINDVLLCPDVIL